MPPKVPAKSLWTLREEVYGVYTDCICIYTASSKFAADLHHDSRGTTVFELEEHRMHWYYSNTLGTV